MKTLGIDPGSTVTGWGLIEGSPSRPRLVECGQLRLRAGAPFHQRLLELRRGIDELLQRLQPGCAAVEWPFHGVNARSALQLAHARGVLLCSLAEHGLEPDEYAPATIKKAVTGSGRADKQQVRGMVLRLLAVPEERVSGSDAADALAVALCHQQSLRHPAGGQGKPFPREAVGGKAPRTWEALVAERQGRRT